MPQKTYQDEENIARQPFEVVDEECFKAGRKTTVCVLTCACGLEVVGTANCVDPDDYDKSIGRKYAVKEAKGKIEEYKGVNSHV